MAKMTEEQKQQYADLKQRFLAEKKRAFEAEPEVDRWVRIQKTIFKVFAVFWILHTVFTIIAMIQMQSEVHFVMEIFKLLFQLFWIYCFISPEGTWRFSVMFFVSVAYNLVMAWSNYNTNLKGILLPVIIQMPVMGIVFIMEILAIFMMLGVGCYLTIPKSHRMWSDRAQEIIKGLQERQKEMINNQSSMQS